MDESTKTRLVDLGFSEEQITKLEAQGVKGDGDMALLSEQDILKITKCTIITAKKAVSAFAPKPSDAAMDNTTIQSILPALPDDKSFLEMLKVGGVLKIDSTNVIAAIRAAIASGVGLYELPDKLVAKMEQFAKDQGEPLGEAFYRLQKQLTQRNYGEVLAALGTNGSFVSERRKKDTLELINSLLWPALNGFYVQLDGWVKTWNQGAANPGILMMAMLSRQGAGGVLPPGMLQPPDTATLRDQAEAVINQINKAFAGTGIPVARALAYDAMRIREAMEDSTIPSTIGAATRDQMLKMLGSEVGADYVRLEQNVAQFALATMGLSKVAAGNEELAYLTAMWTLGTSIPWNKLGSGIHGSSANYEPAKIRGDR